MSADGSSEGDGQSSNDGQDVRYSRHKRQKSKVWGKVSWFSRKSRRHRSQTETSDQAAGTSSGSSRPRSWVGSTSSSEGDLMDTHLAQHRNVNGSDILDKSCIRPSLTHALYMRLDGRDTSDQKRIISGGDNGDEFNNVCDEESFGRTMSMPHGMASPPKEACHCVACCSCSTKERLQGLCPAYLQRCLSTRSLDTALSDLQYSIEHHETSNMPEFEEEDDVGMSSDSSQIKISEESNTNEDQSKSDNVFIKTSPAKLPCRPNYYGQSLLRKCKICGKVLRQWHLTVKTSANLPVLPSTPFFCQCKPIGEMGSRRCSNSSRTASDDSQIYKDKVSAVEFKKKSNAMTEWFSTFNDEQKNLLLKKLLGECDLPQIHMLSTQLSPILHYGCPTNCEDIVTWLPQPLATKIFSYLDPVSLCQASMVCQKWKQLADEPSLWQRFACLPKWQLSKKGEQKQLLNHMFPNGDIHWKQVFAERFRLRNNWLKGRCTIRTFEGHTQGISCVQFDETRIVSGSSDRTIKVWNIRTNSPWSVQTLVGHSGTVRCLHLQGNRLVSGSTDRTIKVWDLSAQQSWSSIACKVTMVGGHQDTVRCLQVDDEKVVSGSYDKTLKIWDIRTGQCQKTLRGHTAAVLCVQFDNEKIISGSCDKTIKVWNFSGACMMTLDAHQDAVTCLQFDNTRIVSGSLDCNLKFWDIKTGKCINTIDWKASEGHTGVVRCLQSDSWRVVSASDDKTLKVWSLDTCERLVTLKNHTDGVTCLQFNDNLIVSGSYDKTVILRDFSCV